MSIPPLQADRFAADIKACRSPSDLLWVSAVAINAAHIVVREPTGEIFLRFADASCALVRFYERQILVNSGPRDKVMNYVPADMIPKIALMEAPTYTETIQ
jgi:hypothetical protein